MDYGILASPMTERLQEVLDSLTGMLYQVGLRTNANKIVGMVCQPCQMVVGYLESKYERQMTKEGPHNRARTRERF